MLTKALNCTILTANKSQNVIVYMLLANCIFLTNSFEEKIKKVSRKLKRFSGCEYGHYNKKQYNKMQEQMLLINKHCHAELSALHSKSWSFYTTLFYILNICTVEIKRQLPYCHNPNDPRSAAAENTSDLSNQAWNGSTICINFHAISLKYPMPERASLVLYIPLPTCHTYY